ncbi:MAG: hypothetical protein HOO94_00985 [Novosphingobium sp.]|uniref:hypothetical protein n=1 Tax=Novosphingobium sp. TaxID=1874826 RepID=UPI0017A148A5|nr:hypothetical protein [Novosphingobium sp.]
MTMQSLLLASVAALLPVAAASNLALAAPTLADSRFSPPSSDLVLTRTLWRSLHDGQQIMIRRRYDVRFVADGAGYRLDGHLIDATVEAPAALAAFAALERNRVDVSLFPVRIDAQGRILIDGTPPPPGAHAAVESLARTALGDAPLAKPDEQAARQQLALITGRTGAIGSLPADLFRPQPGERLERRRIALPGGMEGEVEVATKVAASAPHSVPQTVERVITTTLEGTTRVSREVWSFGVK